MATELGQNLISNSEKMKEHISWLLNSSENTPYIGDFYNDPKIRPPFDYATLCGKSILSCPNGQGTLSEIYAYISGNFPYYAQSWTCWQNSIRHNLSQHKCFVRVEGPSRDGRNKQCRFWTIAENMRCCFTVDGVYINTKAHKRLRNAMMKDNGGECKKRVERRSASVANIHSIPYNSGNSSVIFPPRSSSLTSNMPSVNIAQACVTPCPSFNFSIFSLINGGNAQQQLPPVRRPLTKEKQRPNSISSYSPIKHSLSPGYDNLSPMSPSTPYYNIKQLDIMDVNSPLSLDGFSQPPMETLPYAPPSPVLENFFITSSVPGNNTELDWNAVANYLDLVV